MTFEQIEQQNDFLLSAKNLDGCCENSYIMMSIYEVSSE